MKIEIPDNNLTALTIDGVPFNSLAAAYKAAGKAGGEQLDNAILTAWAALRQAATTAAGDRATARDEAQCARIADLEGKIQAAANNAQREAESLKKEKEAWAEELRIARLPSAEQQLVLIAQERERMAEHEKKLAALETSLLQPAEPAPNEQPAP